MVLLSAEAGQLNIWQQNCTCGGLLTVFLGKQTQNILVRLDNQYKMDIEAQFGILEIGFQSLS